MSLDRLDLPYKNCMFRPARKMSETTPPLPQYSSISPTVPCPPIEVPHPTLAPSGREGFVHPAHLQQEMEYHGSAATCCTSKTFAESSTRKKKWKLISFRILHLPSLFHHVPSNQTARSAGSRPSTPSGAESSRSTRAREVFLA